MTSASVLSWQAQVNLGDGRQLQVRVEGAGCELRIGEGCIAVPAAALTDVLEVLSKAAAEAVWQAMHGGRP